MTHRTQARPARRRQSAWRPAGPGASQAPRPPEERIAVPVPAIVSAETFAQAQAELATNRRLASRHTTRRAHLLRALVRCGACRLGRVARTSDGHGYSVCRGRSDALRAAEGQRCAAR